MDYEQWKKNNVEEYDQCKAILLDYALQDYGPVTKEELDLIGADELIDEVLGYTYRCYILAPKDEKPKTFLEDVKNIRSQL